MPQSWTPPAAFADVKRSTPSFWLSSQDWFHLGATASNATPRFELTDIESLRSSQQTCALRPVSASPPPQHFRRHSAKRRSYYVLKARGFYSAHYLSAFRNGQKGFPTRRTSDPTE